MTRANLPPQLLMPGEVDRLLRFPRGRSVRLAKRNQLPHLLLPDDSYRFPADLLDQLTNPQPVATSAGGDGVLGRIGRATREVARG